MSLSEPHINGTALREMYVCIHIYMYYIYICTCMYSMTITFRIYAYSNLVNRKFTLEQYYTAMPEC